MWPTARCEGIPDHGFGEALAAAVQLVPGAEITEAEVRGWLHHRLAGYKVSRMVHFHEQLPREDTGKIFKCKMREPHWAGRTRRVQSALQAGRTRRV